MKKILMKKKQVWNEFIFLFKTFQVILSYL